MILPIFVSLLFLNVSAAPSQPSLQVALNLDYVPHIINSFKDSFLYNFQSIKLTPLKKSDTQKINFELDQVQYDKVFTNQGEATNKLYNEGQNAESLGIEFKEDGLIILKANNPLYYRVFANVASNPEKELELVGQIDDLSLTFNMNGKQENWLGYEAVKVSIDEKDIVLNIDHSKLEIKSSFQDYQKDFPQDLVKEGVASQVKQKIIERILYLTSKKQMTDDVLGYLEEDLNMNKSPFNVSIRSTIAGIITHNIMSSALDIKIKNNNMYLDFTPLSIGICTDSIYKKLKNIKHGNPADIKAGSSDFVQVLMDQNFVSCMLMFMNTMEETVYMRDWFKKYHGEDSSFLYYMETTTLGYMLPEIEEEYGSGKKVDLEVTVSQEKISQKLPEISNSGFVIEKDGTIKFVFNAAATIKIQKNDTEKNELVWEDARSMFMTLQLRSKVHINNSYDDGFNVDFDLKGLEMSLLKIFSYKNTTDEEPEFEDDEDDDEEDKGVSESLHEGAKLEAMLVQSLVNMKFDQIRKQIGKLDISTFMDQENFHKKFLECFGIEIQLPKLEFLKGQVKLSVPVKKIDPSLEICYEQFDPYYWKDPESQALMRLPLIAQSPIEMLAENINNTIEITRTLILGNGTLFELMRDFSMADMIPEKPEEETGEGISIDEILEMEKVATAYVKKRDSQEQLTEDEEGSPRQTKKGPQTKYSKRAQNTDL